MLDVEIVETYIKVEQLADKLGFTFLIDKGCFDLSRGDNFRAVQFRNPSIHEVWQYLRGWQDGATG